MHVYTATTSAASGTLRPTPKAILSDVLKPPPSLPLLPELEDDPPACDCYILGLGMNLVYAIAVFGWYTY